MGTRCVIGIEYEDGTCKTIHCTHDGYLDHSGKILFEKYNTLEKAHELILLGDINFLDETLEKTESFHNNHDEDWEDWEDCRPSYFDSFESVESWHTSGIVYFMRKDKKWITQQNGKKLKDGYLLKVALSEINNDMDS